MFALQQYRCLNGNCEDTWTKGHQGEPWDMKPAPTPKESAS
jgi:hypothetical protein